MIELEIERLSDEGRGIGFFQGKTVFVRGALAGERVKARITGKKKRLLFAELEHVERPSAERVSPPCELFGRCGGCQWQHLSLEAQRKHREQSLRARLSKFAGLEVGQLEPPITGSALAYRQRVKLSLSGKSKRYRLGFLALQSHDVVSVPACEVLAEPLNQALCVLQQQWLPSLSGLCSGQLSLACDAQRVAINADELRLPEEALQALHTLAKAQHWLWHGKAARAHSEALRWELACVDAHVESWAGDFSQVNQSLNNQLVQRALSWLSLSEGERVLDLFCGMGNFSLACARVGAQVLGVESSESLVQAAEQNAARLGLSERLRFVQTDLYQPELNLREVVERPRSVVLDPPRTGLQSALPAVLALEPSQILYVSCDPVTLARDAKALCEQGYQLTRLCYIDFFPQTEHTEAMALFVREPC